MRRRIMAAAAGAAVLLATQAQAALVLKSNEADFTAALIGGVAFIEDLEAFSAGDSGGLPLSFRHAPDAPRAATLTGPDQIKSAPGGGRHAIDGSNFWEGGATPFEVVFAAATRAFGFWGTDIGDFGTDCGSTDISLCPPVSSVLRIEFFTLASDASAAFTHDTAGNPIDAFEQFWGFVDDSGATYEKVRFTNLTIGLATIVDGQGFDRFMTGDVRAGINAAPEPATLALTALGLLGLAGSLLRRT